MKILTPTNYQPTTTQDTTIKLLEDSRDFEQLVWSLRGRAGIVPGDLKTHEAPTGTALAIYEVFAEDRKLKKLTLARLRRALVSSEEFSASPFYYSKLYGQYVREISTDVGKFIRTFKIPRSWLHPIVEFVLSGEMTISEATEPLHLTQAADGSINIIISAKITPNALHTWLDQNWPKLDAAFTEGDLPDYRPRKIKLLDLYKEAYRLRHSNEPAMSYADIADQLNEGFPDVEAISYEQASEFVDQYQHHLNRLIIG